MRPGLHGNCLVAGWECRAVARALNNGALNGTQALSCRTCRRAPGQRAVDAPFTQGPRALHTSGWRNRGGGGGGSSQGSIPLGTFRGKPHERSQRRPASHSFTSKTDVAPPEQKRAHEVRERPAVGARSHQLGPPIGRPWARERAICRQYQPM